jgi:hypothetical protein
MNIYPSLSNVPNEREIYDIIGRIIYLRNTEDVDEANNYPRVFLRGRRVTRIPSSSADILSGDKEFDVSYDINYLYICILNGSALVWRRISLGVF